MTTNPNLIINGGFDFWQRGISATATGASFLLADMWEYSSGAAPIAWTVSQETFDVGQTDVPETPVYFSRMDITTGTGDAGSMITKIENVGTVSGELVTFSFWGRGTFNLPIQFDFLQNYDSVTSNIRTVIDSFTLTTGWQKFTFSFTAADVSGGVVGVKSSVSPQLIFPTGAIGTIDIANVKFERDGVATPFTRAGNTVPAELTTCQGFYEIGRYDLFNNTGGTITLGIGVQFFVPKRGTPTVIDIGGNTVESVDFKGFRVSGSINSGQWLGADYTAEYRL